jgi:signal transduction histidine kinase
VKELLTIKTGELIAKSEELREVNESLHLLNDEIRKKTLEISNTKKDLTEIERDLVVANGKLTETNDKFALTNKELVIVNKELIMANEQIKQLVLKQKELLDITAHELRTPIQTISGHFELIQMNIPSLLQNSLTGAGNINKDFERLIKDKHRLAQFTNGLISAYRNSRRLEKLVNDILDTSRIESNRLELHKEFFNLNEKIENVIKDIHDKTNNILHTPESHYHVDIVFESQQDPIGVFADKIRIFEVLSNLINNAIKFSNGKPINISEIKVQNKGN